jgi:hypothetical protein
VRLVIQNDDRYTVNSFLDTDDFPTEWDTVAQVAKIVSVSPYVQTHDSVEMCDGTLAMGPRW